MERLGRKAKHINHHVGPGTMKEMTGNRNFVMERTNPRTGKRHEFQRDAGVVLLKKPDPEASGPSNVARASSRPHKHKKGTIPRKGEFTMTNFEPGAITWHVVQVTDFLPDKIKASCYSTQGQSLEECGNTSQDSRMSRLADISFLRTGCLENGRGKAATTKPPKQAVRRTKDL